MVDNKFANGEFGDKDFDNLNQKGLKVLLKFRHQKTQHILGTTFQVSIQKRSFLLASYRYFYIELKPIEIEEAISKPFEVRDKSKRKSVILKEEAF